ncbi:N-acetylmuramic acid 6-phosphate etherase [candidate division NPL-UPA2 bacterium]|nr:N-acetylmuramic acid 6-phosphate etherase [candidate division NPL-UPA2 bacterium]
MRSTTEAINPNSKDLDKKSIEEILRIINAEDRKVAEAVSQVIKQIAQAVKVFVECYQRGGRIFYVGAGTSGRLGILDAAECPPTFGTLPDRIQGVLAGGREAIFEAREGCEDDRAAGGRAAAEKKISDKDFVVGLSASGETPFVLGYVEAAGKKGVTTAAITSNPASAIVHLVDIPIIPVVGPEVIAGSTRMKAGTAEKLVLNMLSTTAMVCLGKVDGNLMIDLRTKSQKLRRRAKRILQLLTDKELDAIERALLDANYEVKPALLMLKAKISYPEAKRFLQKHNGFVREALAELGREE